MAELENKKRKSFASNIRRSWRKLRYLDKTQFSFFVVTSFIGIFCMFTGITYSAFTISKYLNAVTISIARLNYTLVNSTDGYEGTTITVGPNETIPIEFNLISNNEVLTKYAVSYETNNDDVKVYYSQNLKYNLTGNIGTNGANITMRIVIENNSEKTAEVNLLINGGYAQQNDLVSNITEGYYEQPLTKRITLLDEKFENAMQVAMIPKDEKYVYYKTICTEEADVIWDNELKDIIIETEAENISCDIYMKKLSDTIDVEILYNLKSLDGKEELVDTIPEKNLNYGFTGSHCSNDEESFYDIDEEKLSITGITGRTICVANFEEGKRNLIRFTIDNKLYYGLEGMAFKEWMQTEKYNIDEYKLVTLSNEKETIEFISAEEKALYYDEDYITLNDIIVNNSIYELVDAPKLKEIEE